MLITRFIYLGYYIKKLDLKKLKKFLNYAHSVTKRPSLIILLDMLFSVFKYNISLLEYFQFRFFELHSHERRQWAGTGFMYEYQKKMNPKNKRQILINKVLFNQKYNEFIRHRSYSLSELIKNHDIFDELVAQNEKIVIKSSTGGCGVGIEVLSTISLTFNELLNRLKVTNNDLVEEYIVQHDDLMKLSPSGLNTVRIITQLTSDNKVDIVAGRLRISVNSYVDNLAAGNIVACIDIKTGIVSTDAISNDITKPTYSNHPITGAKIRGFQVPFWHETLEMIQKAALKYTDNRSVGWDVAITNVGPELLEANHDWCKLVFQLPAKKGLKHLLERYL